MRIISATFVKGVTRLDSATDDGLPQVAFIGRSNVGKSSVINSVTGVSGLAKTSSFPGRTRQANFFLINKSFYLVDLPGYGFADVSEEGRQKLHDLIDWYLFGSANRQYKVVLIIDAEVGFTEADLEMLHALEDHGKNITIVANKIDKIKPSEQAKKEDIIKELAGAHRLIFYSAKQGSGIGELAHELLDNEIPAKKQVRRSIFGGPLAVRGVKSRKRPERPSS